MTEILAVFRSRSQAIDCNARLKVYGVNASLINTPREANIGCGLSVKIAPDKLERVKGIIFTGFTECSRITAEQFSEK